MVYPLNYKTVIVLDHGARFLQSSNEYFEFDVSSKSKAGSSLSAAVIPQPPLSKSLWTCSIEAALEFCRIVYDIFGKQKLISFLGSNSTASQSLTGWNERDQELDVIQRQFGILGLPSRKTSRNAGPAVETANYSIEYGLSNAIDQLLMPTERQCQARFSLLENADQFENNGRVVCHTIVKNEACIDDIISSFIQTLEEKNRLAVTSDELIPISKCELVLVIVRPIGDKAKVEEREPVQVTPELTVSVVVTDSGRTLANKMVALAVKFFNLVITSVTGIPMKEEQNASSSANYDVELLHSFEAHKELMSDLADGSRAPSQEIDGVDSVTLKWCTPKSSSAGDMQLCLGAFPISPVDVNSRPSLCLTNFLLNGRCVMLEQPRKSGTKVLSHMLSSHGGQIYIHSLSSATTRSVLDDPPSISEGVGGRVTDYRIQDFGELVKEHMLAPIQSDESGAIQPGRDTPSALAEHRLERRTRYWPMTIGETMICNLKEHIEPLPQLLANDTLTDENVNTCRQVIFDLMRLDENGLLSAYSSQKSKRKEEYSRQLWTELDQLIGAHASNSERHAQVYGILTSCKPAHIAKFAATSLTGQPPIKRPKSSSSDLSAADLSTASNGSSLDAIDAQKSLQLQTDHIKKTRNTKPLLTPIAFKGEECLLSIWSRKLNTINNSRHAQFSGSIGASNKAVLYSKLNTTLMEPVDDSPLTKNCPDH